jgi:Ca2+-binding RTX toxin-like protein
VDSDADAVRQMAQATGHDSNYNGIELKFVISAADQNGNPVRIYYASKNGTQVDTKGSITKNLYVHVYGSNDAPEMFFNNGTLTIRDDDISKFVSGNSKDAESHKIKINFRSDQYSAQTYSAVDLKNGKITETSSNNTITYDVVKREVRESTDSEQAGTYYEFSNFKINGETMTGEAVFMVWDARNGYSKFAVSIRGGQAFARSEGIAISLGTDDSTGFGGAGAENGNLYGTGGDDILKGSQYNDSLWGGLGADSLAGEKGNDRLFGEAGDDTLNGGAGIDVLVGGAGNDELNGGDGDDVLIGDGGKDVQNLVAGTANAESF